MNTQPQKQNSLNKLSLLICLSLGLFLWLLPKPADLSTTSWYLLIIFLTTIAGLITKPLPMGAVALVSLTTLTATKILSLQEAFSGFTNEVVWLVIMAFFIAKGFVNTGLGNRIAYLFTSLFGRKTLGLSYGLVCSELLMAPAIPSATARSAGIIYPIIAGIANSYASYPNDPSAKRIGSFLVFTAFQVTVITSAMFMTAMAANPLIAVLVSAEGYTLDWGTWALAASLPGLASLIVIPLMLYWLYPPEITKTPNAPEIAAANLRKMGPISTAEIIMLSTICLLLTLWGFGQYLAIRPVTTAMLGLCVLLLTNVLKWEELLKINSAWETLFWFSTLVTLATLLNEYGLIAWMKDHSTSLFGDSAWQVSFSGLCLVYFYSHYFFASSTAHVSAMYASFLSLSIALGTPTYLAIFSLSFFSALFGGLTHYSLAPAPLLFGAGYVNIKDWWRLGFICSIVNIAIWATLGASWWRFLGFW